MRKLSNEVLAINHSKTFELRTEEIAQNARDVRLMVYFQSAGT